MSNRVQPRISAGAGKNGLNLKIIPFDERADFKEAEMTPSKSVWLVDAIFTTLDGSWTADGKPYGIEQWAVDKYWFAPGNPRHYPGMGGATHIHVMSCDAQGVPFPSAGFLFTSDGPENLQPATDPSRVVQHVAEGPHGWANQFMLDNSSMSRPPALGPWSAAKQGMSDIVQGMGLPLKAHVSTCIVWREMTWADYKGTSTSPNEPPPPSTQPGSDLVSLVSLASSQMAGTRSPATIAKRAADVLALLKEAANNGK